MPRKLRSACRVPGCPDPQQPGSSRCAKHTAQLRHEYDSQRGSGAARGYDALWRRNRARFLKYHPVCECCGKPATEPHHRIPRRRGGRDTWDNLEALCHSCHSRKTVLDDGGLGRPIRKTS